MRIRTPYSAIAATVLLAVAVVSCSGKGTKTPSPISPTPTPTPTPSAVRLELSVPPSIAPGTSVQLSVNAVKSDNSVENVTARAQWFSSDPRVIEVDSSGVAKANAFGETVITVRYQTLRAAAQTLVVPAGSYRLKGTVKDSGLGLSGVTITVITGVGEGLTATTDGNGGYALYGVRGRVVLQAKRDGYLNGIEELDVTDNRLFDFEMTLDRDRPDVRGRYALTISRMPCAGDLPNARTYDATVDQNGPRLAVTLSGADFIITRGHGNTFTGIMDGPDRVTFSLGAASVYYYYYYYGQYDLVERISTNALIIDGKVTAAISPKGITGTLNGDFLLAQGNAAPFTRIVARCSGPSHRFEMTRR